MKYRILRQIFTSLLLACFISHVGVMAPVNRVSAADNTGAPGRPTFTAKVTDEENAVKFTVSKTENADGYKIYKKGPGDEKFKLLKTIAKSGAKTRTYTKKDLGNGFYEFKVRAYRVEDGKKVYGSYSRVISVSIDCFDEENEEKYADITFKNGYAYFASYPQSKVTDSAVIAALNKLPDGKSQDGAVYNGKRYFYAENGRYWCQEEPIEWVILEGSADSKSVTLMSNKMLLECGHSDWAGFEAGGKWENSFVRYALNSYNGSFKNIWSFAFFRVAFAGNIERALMKQSYDGCEDKVLLPSKKQLSELTPTQRIRKASDFCAKADKQGYWCIDTDGKGNIALVNTKGEFTTHQAWRQDGEGYVPVIKVDLRRCNVIIE